MESRGAILVLPTTTAGQQGPVAAWVSTAGCQLARELGVPSVVFVPAPLVWQAQQWGVRRPGWSRWIERSGERGPLNRADVVACGSASVAEQVARMGVAEARIVVTATGSD